MLETTIAGSLPKPAWLAKPRMLWAPWQLEGEALVEAKRDATMLALKEQEDTGIDIVTDGEQARQHFVHGFLEHIEGVDFARRVTMGIRNNRYNAEVPTVTGPLRRKQSVHAVEAEFARAHTQRRRPFDTARGFGPRPRNLQQALPLLGISRQRDHATRCDHWISQSNPPPSSYHISSKTRKSYPTY